MSAARCGPGLTARGTPHSEAKTAAAGDQVAPKPHAQLRVVDHKRVAIVGAMAGAEGRWQNLVKVEPPSVE